MFIASSVEGLQIAYAIQAELEHDVESTIWSQGIFTPSAYAVDDIAEELEKSDFGAFVFSPDDAATIRGEDKKVVRDNVLFELGMFVGELGRKRNFIIQPRSVEDFRVPSDLAGLKPLTFDQNRSDGNLRAALGPAANEIRKAVQKQGALSREETTAPTSGESSAKTVTLSEKASTVLSKAAEDSTGSVIATFSSSVFVVQTHQETIFDGGSPREEAAWKAAVKQLINYGLLEDLGDGSVFDLTEQGWNAADQIKKQTTN
jgi:hypothetical protein